MNDKETVVMSTLNEIEKLSRTLEETLRKLRIAYAYKDELYSKMDMADRNIQSAQAAYFRALHDADAAISRARAAFLDDVRHRISPVHPLASLDKKEDAS